MRKDLERYLKELSNQGWFITKGSKHYKMIAPNGIRLTCSLTPSCVFALKHIKGDVKRALRKIS